MPLTCGLHQPHGQLLLLAQLEGLEGLIQDGGEDEEMKGMAREEKAALLEEVCSDPTI